MSAKLRVLLVDVKSYLVGSFIQDNEQWGIFSMHALAKSPLFLQVAV